MIAWTRSLPAAPGLYAVARFGGRPVLAEVYRVGPGLRVRAAGTVARDPVAVGAWRGAWWLRLPPTAPPYRGLACHRDHLYHHVHATPPPRGR